MRNWVKHFIGFMRISKEFLGMSYMNIILKGGLYKAFGHANFMAKYYDKLSPEEKELWYVNENRVLEM